MVDLPPAMVGEDFGEFGRAEPDRIGSLIFRVGAVPPERIAAARQGGAPLPTLHSPFFAPDAPAAIAAASEALTLAAMTLMAKAP